MRRTLLAIAIAIAGCSTPPDAKVSEIPKALTNPVTGDINFSIQYSTNYDASLSHGYWFGTGNPPIGPYQRASPAIGTFAECPKVWVYVCSTSDPSCSAPYLAVDNISTTSTTWSPTGVWPDPTNGSVTSQIVNCYYNVRPTVEGYNFYKVWVGRSCTNWGGYASGGQSAIAIWTTDRVDPTVPFAWNRTVSGPYLNRSSWQTIAASCNGGPLVPATRTYGPIAKCSQVVGQTCQARVNTSFTW